MNRVLFFLILVITVGSYQYWVQREEVHPPGVLVSEVPVQKESSSKSIKYKDVVLDTLAEYSIRARVLSTERYWIDRLANVAPTDVALGWGVMSDSSVIKDLNIWQEGRFYFYSWSDQPPTEPTLITKSSANMHLIPGTTYIAQEIRKLRRGQIVGLRGYLVRVNFPDGSDARSSLAREDSGAGACEIMWVQSIEVM